MIKSTLPAIATAAAVFFSGCACAQSWSPQKNVEIVVGSAPGGSNDKTGRTVEKILSEKKLVPGTITVNNKPGGGGNISLTYVSQKTGDAHFLAVATPSLLTNHIVGQGSLNYTDFTPIASLFNDYIVFAVNPDSPIKNGRDLVERLKKDPKSISIGFATALGSHNHIGAGLLMKAIGGEVASLDAYNEGTTDFRAILTQMRDDEVLHGRQARDAGGVELPGPVKSLMRLTGRIMTTAARVI